MDDEESNAILKECLQKQIDELDIISSIYCNPGELVIDDHSIAADINLFLSSDKNDQIPTNTLDYRIYLQDNGEKFEIRIELPHLYPALELPEVHLSSSTFTKAREKEINKNIYRFIRTKLNENETYIYEVIIWIQENLEQFIAKDQETSEDMNTIEFERLWIYSHHIKSKTKRQIIVKKSKDYRITGFLLPGKPGVICIEGEVDDTQGFWKFIRSLSWQKITIRKSEIKELKTLSVDKCRKFSNFKEVMFTEMPIDENNETLEEVKMSMSLFMKYLEQHNCNYIKNYLFGFS